jgi:hypothetical protein
MVITAAALPSSSRQVESRGPQDCDDKPDCRKVSPWDLKQAGITDPHAFKTENGAVPWSRFDICKCKDGTIRIARVGQFGKTRDFWY